MTVTNLFFYFRLLAFLLLNVANKTTLENSLQAKLGTLIEEQGATKVESLWKGVNNQESPRTTDRNVEAISFAIE